MPIGIKTYILFYNLLHKLTKNNVGICTQFAILVFTKKRALKKKKIQELEVV
jgi:hypothetical protein